MSEETNHGVKSVVMEDKCEDGEGVPLKVMNKGALCLDVSLS